nr:H380 [uncultured bacterium]
MSVLPTKSRVFEIDRAKGLTILLVVIGYIEGRTPLHGAEWYGLLAAAGMLLPIAFKKWVLARSFPLDRMFS